MNPTPRHLGLCARAARGVLLLALLLGSPASSTQAQSLFRYEGDVVPSEIEGLYVRGLQYLKQTQTESGGWPGSHGEEPGVIGLAVMAMLAHGDDPNYGPYSANIRKALNRMLTQQQVGNGYLGSSMYNHGFATLALAEAYGAVDDDRIGPALKKAVGLILTSQARNREGGWRYSPESNDADTTVSGAQVVAMVAARNAGIPVPQAAIDRAILYYETTRANDGGFGYTSGARSQGSSAPRSAIGTLVFALTRNKKKAAFREAYRSLEDLTSRGDGSYPFYYLYYAAQAYFHADMAAWTAWSRRNQQMLSSTQGSDGRWEGPNGPTFSTASALLSIALHYRFLPIYER